MASSTSMASPTSFALNVYINGTVETVPVFRNSNIRDLKNAVGRRRHINPAHLSVVFAGAELDDNFSFQNCDIAHGSVLHVIIQERSAAPPSSADVKSSRATDREEENFLTKSRKARFYVYCKCICKRLCVGKLRVRCRKCKSQGFRFSREPASWDDVLKPSQIRGSCIDENCQGRFTDFFFKCAEHTPSGDDQGEACPLSMVKSNILDVPCLICMEVKPIVLVFSCSDGHTICVDCFNQYCEHQINARQFLIVDSCEALAYTVVCPGRGKNCNSSFVSGPHHFRIPGNSFYERYQGYAAEDTLLRSGGVLCPGRGCGNGLIPAGTQRRVVCERRHGGCGLVFCRRCSSDYHEGSCNAANPRANIQSETRVVSEEAAQRARWDTRSRELIEEITKRCPKCNVPIEKNGGCNHMTCRACSFEFCWLCLVQWGGRCYGNHCFT